MATTAGQPLGEQADRMPITFASIWNTTAPVSRLPFDVLTQIFLIYVQWYHYGRNWDVARVPQWVDVSYVCRHWREAALNFKTLWSYMFVASRAWTNELLARSGEVPLRVIICFSGMDGGPAIAFVQQVIPHVGRFQECILYLNPSDVIYVLPILSSRSAPLLRRLEITVVTQLFWHWLVVDAQTALDAPGDNPAPTNYTLFNNDTPALREFRLTNHPLSWYRQAFSTLKVLGLRDLLPADRPTIMQLKSVLSSMSCLEHLELEDAFRDDLSDRSILEAEKVHLPRLNYLMVSGYVSEIMPFLSCLTIPLTARVRIRCRLRMLPDEDEYQPLFAFLSRNFGNCPAWRPHVLPASGIWHTFIMHQIRNGTHIVLSSANQSCGKQCSHSPLVDCDCDMPLKVGIEWPFGTEHYHDLVLGICRSISLAPMLKLIVMKCEPHRRFWFDIIWHLRNLQCIEFVDVDFKEIVFLLGLPARLPPDHADMSPSRRSPQVFVQSLRHLCLNTIKIGRQVRCRGDDMWHGWKQVELFHDVLVERSKKGACSLTRLSICGSTSFTQEEVRRLEKVVGVIQLLWGAKLLPDPADAYCEDCMWPRVDDSMTILDTVLARLNDDIFL